MSRKKYYLAYGSNLNIAQMKYRCPTAKPVGTAIIKDYELLFKGSKTGAYLTIEPKDGAFVPVAVWEVTANDETKLDLYEGFPTFYYKKEFDVAIDFFDRKGAVKKSAFVYIMHEERKIAMPSGYYIQVCKQGYQDFGFDTTLISQACKKSLEGVRKYEN